MLREALVALTVLVAAPSVAGGIVYTYGDATNPILARVGFPDDPWNATVLVAVAHGYGHTTASWENHLHEFADAGAFAVAVEYDNWDADTGAARLVSETRAFLDAWPNLDTVVLLGFSMGGAASALALQTDVTKPDGSPLFDLFVAGEGVSMLHETYLEANLVAPAAAIARNTVLEIEAECGSPASAVCLAERSYAAQAFDIAANGLEGAWVIHDVNDGLVPYNQGVEGAAALAAAGIPVAFTTVLRSSDCGDEVGTTITGYAGQRDVACLAGHSSEASSTQAVIRLTLDTVLAAIGGARPQTGLHVADSGQVLA